MSSTVTLRIGDRERQATVDALRGAYEAGCLDLAELESRLDAAWGSRTQPELDRLRVDLPDAPDRPAAEPRTTAAPARKPLHRDSDVLAFGFAMALMAGIWLATGAGYPWPLWVLLGWGPAVVAKRALPEGHPLTQMAAPWAPGPGCRHLRR